MRRSDFVVALWPVFLAMLVVSSLRMMVDLGGQATVRKWASERISRPVNGPTRYTSSMRRNDLTYRVVPLQSAEAGSAPAAVTLGQRLEMIRELSRMAWSSAHRTPPAYTRATMPIRLSTLAEQGGPNDR